MSSVHYYIQGMQSHSLASIYFNIPNFTAHL